MNSPHTPAATGITAEQLSLAGFWQRTYAALIDTIIIGIIETIVGSILMPLLFVVPLLYTYMHPVRVVGMGAEKGPDTLIYGTVYCLLFSLVLITLFLVSGVYSVLFESSRFQATPGKMALGLKVSDIHGERISRKRGAIKLVAQYSLYALIIAASFASAAAIIAMYKEPHLHQAVSTQQLILFALPFLAPLVVGNMLYLGCFSFLVFSDRKQTVFDRLVGRLVWENQPIDTVSGMSTVSGTDAVSGAKLVSRQSRATPKIVVRTFIFISVSLWVFYLIRSETHASLELSSLVTPIFIAILAYIAALFVVQMFLFFALEACDAGGVIRYARIVSGLSLGSRRKLWRDRASAMSLYVQGDTKVAEELLLNWDGKFYASDLDHQLHLRLYGCIIAGDTDGTIDNGRRMSQRPVFRPVHKLIVAGAHLRKGDNKGALSLLDTITETKSIHSATLNAYFAGYYARLGCEQELDTTLAWLGKSKYPLTSNWKLQLQGNCAAARGSVGKARSLLQQALKEVSIGASPEKQEPLMTTIARRAIEKDLKKLEDLHNQTEADPVDLSAFRRHLKQIAKRMAIVGETASDSV